MCLVDFGVAFRMGENFSNDDFIGTTAYCAPEVLNGKSEYGPAADM